MLDDLEIGRVRPGGGDYSMGALCGEFLPSAGYTRVKPLFRQMTDAIENHGDLTELYKKRDNLNLKVVSSNGTVISVGFVMIYDVGVEGVGEIIEIQSLDSQQTEQWALISNEYILKSYVWFGRTSFTNSVRIFPGEYLTIKTMRGLFEKKILLEDILDIGIAPHLWAPCLFIVYRSTAGKQKTQRIVIDVFDPETIRLCRYLRQHLCETFFKDVKWTNEYLSQTRPCLPIMLRVGGLYIERIEFFLPLFIPIIAASPLILLVLFYDDHYDDQFFFLVTLLLVYFSFCFLPFLTKCLTVRLNAEGVTIKFLRSRFLAWPEIKKVEVKKCDIREGEVVLASDDMPIGGRRRQFFEFNFFSKDQDKPLFFRLPPPEAGRLLKELMDRKLLNETWLDSMVM